MRRGRHVRSVRGFLFHVGPHMAAYLLLSLLFKHARISLLGIAAFVKIDPNPAEHCCRGQIDERMK